MDGNTFSQTEPAWSREAYDRVQRQAALVAKLQPGTSDHERATKVLLILQDSLHVLIESKAMIARVKAELPKPIRKP